MKDEITEKLEELGWEEEIEKEDKKEKKKKLDFSWEDVFSFT